MLILLLGTALAAGSAENRLETARFLIDRQARAQQKSMLYGARTASGLELAYRWRRMDADSALIEDLLEIELSGDDGPRFQLLPSGRLALGDQQPVLQGGDIEPGLASLRVRADGRGYFRDFELMVMPELGIDVGPGVDPSASLPLGWAGYHSSSWRIGFGVEDRWFGPGRFGGLMLTDNARPAPLGSIATEHRFGESPARFRAEVGAGWLDAPRSDVTRPGWLLVDLRFSPIPQLEVGATRTAIFGGVDRPVPQLGQLILPTKPHVENDPDQLLPDQDEMAALDVRVTLPINQWLPDSRVDYLEVWGQYGGEDVIGRHIGPIPVPALAGVANLWGGELAAGDWTATVEWARLLDDRFRWYTGHRVYHDGFTQLGQSMGHPSGGDSRSWNAAVRWMPGEWGGELSVADVRRVGAIDVAQGRLRTLMSDEVTRSASVRGWLYRWGSWWNAGLTVTTSSNVDFKTGRDEVSWRLFIGF